MMDVTDESSHFTSNKDTVTIHDLPDEVLEFILSLVSPYGDLNSCALTCHRWRHASNNVIRKRQSDFCRAVEEMRMVWSSCGSANSAIAKSKDVPGCTNGAVNDIIPPERTKTLAVGKR